MSGTGQIDKYRVLGGAQPKAAPVAEKDPYPYEAFRLAPEGVTPAYLVIHRPFPEPAEAYPIHYGITKIIGEVRMGLMVTIEFGTQMVITIEGQNLQDLFDGLAKRRLEAVTMFDPMCHAEITDPDVPVVKSLTVHTHRPEPLPPMKDRH